MCKISDPRTKLWHLVQDAIYHIDGITFAIQYDTYNTSMISYNILDIL